MMINHSPPFFLLLLIITFFATHTFLRVHGYQYKDDKRDTSIDWDITLFPATADHDLRSYFQGVIIVDCDDCNLIQWSLDIQLPPLPPGKTVGNYFEMTKGSLTTWSNYLSSDSLCINQSPLTHEGTLSTIFFSCLNQHVESSTSFSGHFRWAEEYYRQFIGQAQRDDPFIKTIIFNMTYTITYNTKEVVVVSEDRTIALTINNNAGIVNYITIDQYRPGKFELYASFLLPERPLVNTLAIRPFGALGHEVGTDGLTFQNCYVNGVNAIQYPKVQLLPLDLNETPRDIHSNGLFSSYIFSLAPHMKPHVPYSNLETFVFNDVYLTIKCSFSHNSRFYVDELPFGLAVFVNQTDIYKYPNDPTEFNPETYKLYKHDAIDFIRKAPLWFLPRVPVFYGRPTGSSPAKYLKPLAAYFSGITYADNNNNGKLGGAVTYRFQLLQSEGILACVGEPSQRSSTKFMLFVELHKIWDISSMRYTLFAPSNLFKYPQVYNVGYAIPSKSKFDETETIFDKIPFCDALTRLNASAVAHNINEPLALEILFEINGKIRNKVEPPKLTDITEYHTPQGYTPQPFNVLVAMQQYAHDYLGRSSLCYQTTTMSWSSNYQIVGSNQQEQLQSSSTQQPQSIIQMKIDSDNKPTKIQKLMINPLDLDFSLFLFWFSTATYRFQFNPSTISSHLKCQICVGGTSCTNASNQYDVEPHIITYPTLHSAVAFRFDFKAHTLYHIDCPKLTTVYFTQTDGLYFTKVDFKTHKAIIDKKDDVHINLHAFPTTPGLTQYFEQYKQREYDSITRLLNETLLDYKNTTIPKDIIYTPDETVRELYLHAPHFTQIKIHVTLKSFLKNVLIAVGILSLTIIIGGTGIIIYFCRKKQTNLRKSALMEYTDFYQDSVQEYMS